MRFPELPAALLVARVQHRAVGENQSCTHHHTVAVGMHATVHARGIVDHDAAHHCRTDRGGIRREHTVVRLQDLIHPRPYDAWLQFYTFAIWRKYKALPVLARHDEHTVRTTLSGERSTCRTEGEGQFILTASLDYFGDLLLTVTADDDFRNLAIETGIGSPSEGTEFICVNTVRRQE